MDNVIDCLITITTFVCPIEPLFAYGQMKPRECYIDCFMNGFLQ